VISADFPYQTIGAQHMAARRRFGLFDKPGVGKSRQYVRACDLVGARRVMCVVPAAGRSTLVDEFRTTQIMQRRIVLGKSIHDFVAWQNALFDVIVPSYEMAVKWTRYVHEAADPIDAIIFDEGHNLREMSTQRARTLLGDDATGRGGLAQWGVRCWWGTGTPLWNDPADIYTFLRFCGVMPLDREAFIRRYFFSTPKAYGGSRQDPLAPMVPELRALIQNNSICRTMQDVQHYLPPIHVTKMLVDGNSEDVRRLLLAHPGLDKAILKALESGNLAGIKTEHTTTLRRLIGEAKAVPYAQTIVDELKHGLDYAVCFGVHRHTLSTVADYANSHGVRAVLINGDTPPAELDARIKEFKSGKARLFVANIKKAGVVLTLTIAAALDMLESEWAPAANHQAILRVQRLTQMRAVRARFVTLANSFDEAVNQIVADKTAAIAAVEGHAMIAAPA